MNDKSPPTSQEVMGPGPAPGLSPPCPAVGWENITDSALLSRGPVLFWGLVLTDVLEIWAVVYDGVNANGRRVCSVKTIVAAVGTAPLLLEKPLLFQNGLYVSLSAAPDDCLVLFDPLPSS